MFLVLHFYVLAQLRLLAVKVTAFLELLDRQTNQNDKARKLALNRLDNFSIVQLFLSERYNYPQWPVRMMAWTTLALAPLLLLLFFQLRFLPYHDPELTMWHRTLVGVDLFLIWWLWPTFIGKAPSGFWYRGWSPWGLEWKRWWKGSFRWFIAFLVLLFSWLLATVPDEPLDVSGPVITWLRAALFDGAVDPVTQRLQSPFSRRLVLLDQDFLTDAQKKAWDDTPDNVRNDLPRTLVLRGRDLRNAVLDRADLRKADFTGLNSPMRVSGMPSSHMPHLKRHISNALISVPLISEEPNSTRRTSNAQI